MTNNYSVKFITSPQTTDRVLTFIYCLIIPMVRLLECLSALINKKTLKLPEKLPISLTRTDKIANDIKTFVVLHYFY